MSPRSFRTATCAPTRKSRPATSALGPKYGNDEPHAHNAINWDPTRLEFLDAGGFWLSDTFHRFPGRRLRAKDPVREARIDWILVRGERWVVQSCKTVRDAEPPVCPSGHYPVVAKLWPTS